MAVSADNLDVILRVIGLRTFQAQMGEARASVLGVGKAAVESDAKQATAAERSAKRMAALRGVGIGVAATLAVAAGESVKMSMQYQRQIEQIHTQAGMSQRDTDSMYRSILDMSRKFPQGPEEMAKAAYHMASVTHDMRTSMEGTRVAAELAAVGNAHLEDTSSALAAVWRADSEEGMNFQQIAALLNATVGAGNMRMNDLVAALGTGVLPVFRTGGVTLKDFAASLALLTDEGQHADNAATHLRMTLTLLAAPSKIARKELHSIGLDAFDLANKMRSPQGMIGALDELRKKLYAAFPGKPLSQDQANKIMNGMSPAQAGIDDAASRRMNVLARAFGGARSGATIMALVDNLEALQGKYRQVDQTQKNFGDDVAKTLHLPIVRVHTAVSNLDVDMIHLGDRLRGPVTDALVGLLGVLDGVIKGIMWMMNAVRDTVGWYKNLPGPVKDAVGAIAIFVGSIAGALAIQKGLAIATAAWEALAGAITLARYAAVLFVLENPILAGIAALIAIIAIVVTHWHWFKRAISDVAMFIMRHKNWLLMIPIIGPLLWGLAQIIAHWKTIKRWINDVWEALKGFWHWLQHHSFGILQGTTSPALPRVERRVGPGAFHPLGHAEGGTMPYSGFTSINERAQGETIWLPGGATVQPAPAGSLAQPRAHIPNPAPQPSAPGETYLTPIVLQLDRKVLYSAVARATADHKARRGGPA